MQFLALAEKQRATVPLMIGHRLVGTSLQYTGMMTESRAHYDQAVALYDPGEHRQLATRFGQDVRVAIFSHWSLGLWVLGFPDTAFKYTEQALEEARLIGHAATLMTALTVTSLTLIHCGSYFAANSQADEDVSLADEKSAIFWKAMGKALKGCILALTHNASEAVETITSGITMWRSTGATVFMPAFLSYLSMALAQLRQFDAAWRCVEDATIAVETTKETWYEAEVNRMAGEVALLSPEPEKAEAHFNRALAVARQQQAKSWELRAAMSSRAPLARPGQGAASARTVGSGVWVVYGGLRHA